jgi:alanine racemase
MKEYSSSWLEISKEAILNNLEQFQKIAAPGSKLMPIIKSNAYGHGLIAIADILKNQKIWGLGAFSLDEAIEIKKRLDFKKPILVLGYFLKENKNSIRYAIKNNIQFSIYNFDDLELISKIAQKINQKAKIYLKVDVGTSRIGILEKDLWNFVKKSKALKNIKIVGVFAHLADSENRDWTFTRQQIQLFDNITKKLEKSLKKPLLCHIACTAACLSDKKTHYSLIRLGIGLFGLWPSAATKQRTLRKYPHFKLNPALSWKTKIIQVKNLAKNTYIGYGCTYKTKSKIKIAVLPVGYWDGYDRGLSNRGEVLVRGKRCKILGRVCMNMMMVDVSKMKSVKQGDEAVILGKQAKEEVTADEIAQKVGTINYEVVTRINPLLKRIYV